MAKVIKTVNAEGVASYTEEDTTLVGDLLSGVTSVFSVFTAGEPTTFVSEKTCGMTALAAVVGGIFVGDKYGDSIPLLGGRR